MNVDQLPIAVVSLDRDLIITAANDAAAALIGVESKELLGAPVTEAFRPRKVSGEDLCSSGWSRAAYFRGTRRITEQEIILRKADTTEIEVMLDGGYERDETGELLGATILLRPKYRGARRLRSGVRIVSAVSHELRSPLTSVRGYTSLLLKRWDSVSDADRKMMLQQIDRDARRISRMIGELLDISRLETGRLQLNRQQVDLSALAIGVLETVEITYPDVDAEVRFPLGFPEVWADPDKIGQVLTNLVENACKYASPKGIVVQGSMNGDDIVVKVTDRGPGIPAGDLPRLFQQFFRSAEGRPTGTGLGLWISRGLIEAHGGHLTAESDEKTGTRFQFTLPKRAFDEVHGLAR